MPHGSDSPTVQHPDRPGVCQPLGTGAGTRLARGRAEAPEPRPGDAPAPASGHAAGPPLWWEEPPSAGGTQNNSENTLPHPRKVGAARPLPAGRAECSPPRGGPRGWVPLRRSSGAHGGARCHPCGGGCRPLPTACWAHTGPSASGSALGPRQLSKRIKGRRRPLSAAGQSLPGTWDTPQRQGVLSAPLPRRGPCCLSPGHVVCEGAPRQRSEGRPGPSPAARPPPPAGLAPAHAPAPSPARGLRRGAAVPAPP